MYDCKIETKLNCNLDSVLANCNCNCTSKSEKNHPLCAFLKDSNVVKIN